MYQLALPFFDRSVLARVNESSNIGQKASVGIKLVLYKSLALISVLEMYRICENPWSIWPS